jgi:prepilin-type N-terminal cleavage/methylation domain-containing protein
VPSQRPSSESGFTLVELLVVMTLSLIVLFAVFTMFDGFTSSSARQLRVTDANDQARRAIDDAVRDLRHAATIVRSDPNDLVYSVSDAASGSRTERICLSPANDVYAARGTTSASPGTACPSSGAGWTTAKLANRASTNTAADPIFRYDSADPTKVKAIGITLSLDTSGGGQTNNPATIRSSAIVRRAAGILNVIEEDLDADCTETGALLNLDISGLGAATPVTVTYATDGGIALGTGLVNVPIPTGVTKVVATITDALGVTKQITKDVECG